MITFGLLLRARAIINGPSYRAVDFVADRDGRTKCLPAAQTQGQPTKSCHKRPSENGPFIIARALSEAGPLVNAQDFFLERPLKCLLPLRSNQGKQFLKQTLSAQSAKLSSNPKDFLPSSDI